MTVTPYSVPASLILDQLSRCGITHFVTMPDYVQISVNHLIAEGRLPGVEVINCATEDEAVAIAFGLHIGGSVPYLSMQNQGLYACANAIRSVGVDARIPVPMLIGQWGRELANLGDDPTKSSRLVVRQIESVLDALEIPRFRLESPADIDCVSAAFHLSHERSTAAAVLVGAHTSWD